MVPFVRRESHFLPIDLEGRVETKGLLQVEKGTKVRRDSGKWVATGGEVANGVVK